MCSSDLNLNLSVGTLSFGDSEPNSLIGKRVQKVFSQSDVSKTGEFVYVAIVHRWAELKEPKSTKFNIDVSGLQLVFDQEVMKGYPHVPQHGYHQCCQGGPRESEAEQGIEAHQRRGGTATYVQSTARSCRSP